MGTESSERRSGEQLSVLSACVACVSLPQHAKGESCVWVALLALRLVPLSPFERNFDCLCSESSGLLALWAS